MAPDELVLDFAVDASPPRAFELWTLRCGSWWPPAHTLTGAPTAITFEPQVGGRIVERGAGGEEHAWGTVLEWDPPRRLRYLWHLFFEPDEATEVEVSFAPAARGTAIRLRQSGWERLGEAGETRRARTGAAWGTLLDLYTAACAAAGE